LRATRIAREEFVSGVAVRSWRSAIKALLLLLLVLPKSQPGAYLDKSMVVLARLIQPQRLNVGQSFRRLLRCLYDVEGLLANE